MDHIQGLGFFSPLRDPLVETHIWGPISTERRLAERLSRYLSPPLFPVRLRELQNNHIHDVSPGTFELGELRVTTDLIVHPGPTLGYRIEEDGKTLVYMPDHEVALGHETFPGDPRWTSGFALAEGATMLIHDAQYTELAYADKVGWGHSTLYQLLGFAQQAGVGTVVTFHHDPEHPDDMLDQHHSGVVGSFGPDFTVMPGKVDTVPRGLKARPHIPSGRAITTATGADLPAFRKEFVRSRVGRRAIRARQAKRSSTL